MLHFLPELSDGCKMVTDLSCDNSTNVLFIFGTCVEHLPWILAEEEDRGPDDFEHGMSCPPFACRGVMLPANITQQKDAQEACGTTMFYLCLESCG
jgi:hypothetical protein